MNNLQTYLQDGANYQARAVLMCLQRHENIGESYNIERNEYEAEIKVARWENCREQGYVVMLRNKKHDQINIAFFEHRNTDCICAIRWLQQTINSPTIETARFGEGIYKDKYDTTFDVGYGEFEKMSEWIYEELTEHWIAGTKTETIKSQ